jgi:hypothetical protein
VRSTTCPSNARNRVKSPILQFHFMVMRLIRFYLKEVRDYSLSHFLKATLRNQLAPRSLRYYLVDFAVSVKIQEQKKRKEEELEKERLRLQQALKEAEEKLERELAMERAKAEEQVARELAEREAARAAKPFKSMCGLDEVGYFTTVPEGKKYTTISFKNKYGDYSYYLYDERKRKDVKHFLTKSQISIVLNRGGLELNPGPKERYFMLERQGLRVESKKARRYRFSFDQYMELHDYVRDDLRNVLIFESKVYSYYERVLERRAVYDSIVTFQFNPFLPSNARAIINYEDDGDVIRGHYDMNGRITYFEYDRNSTLYRVHYDLWSQYFSLPALEGFDLVSTHPMRDIRLYGYLVPIRVPSLSVSEKISYLYSCLIQEEEDTLLDVSSDFYLDGEKIRAGDKYKEVYRQDPERFFVRLVPDFQVHLRGGTTREGRVLRIAMVVENLPHNKTSSICDIPIAVSFSDFMMSVGGMASPYQYNQLRFAIHRDIYRQNDRIGQIQILRVMGQNFYCSTMAPPTIVGYITG